MTYPFGSYEHVHISEREGPHHWPDGQWDPAGWEDCLWTGGLELYRYAGGDAPPTLAEAEALRDAAGVTPTGKGSTHDGLRRGMLVRYGRSFRRGYGEAELVALGPGNAAAVSGSLGHFPKDHPLRRWDPDYVDGHLVVLYRVDRLARWWWCDGLAPAGYSGQWVTDAQARQFMYDGSLFSHARLGEFTAQEAEMIPFVDARSRNVDLAAGVVLYDSAHKPVRTLNVAVTVVSPFIVDGTYRAAFASIDGLPQLVLIRKADATNVRVTNETAHLVEVGRLEGQREEWDLIAREAKITLPERP
jgi:hypothetical protein